ncbi:MAG: hypothetical protein K6F26_10070 [Lachnospiraceae bacterium]|nr:hypothetical protein [Lachnospiraceae bacterium]
MEILDTTIRDGSYAVNFKFSCKDVKDLVTRSHKLGLKYIEIGHGLGINASSAKYGYSLHTDEEYIKAAREVAGDSKLGCFCIPGIAKIEDIPFVREYGVDFLRIGVTPSNYMAAFPYIDACKANGIEAFVNFMKTYIVSPEVFADASKEVHKAGAGCVYIVDSAGSMDKSDIDEYITATRAKTDVKMGFHGHNNLGLAVDNSLHCIEKGLEFVDCSFQGLGRSLGNASLEQVIMLMEKRGYATDFDIPRVLEYGYAGLRNIVRERLVNPLDYVCGFAGFHSSYLKDIYRCCCEKKVDPLRLIIAYSKVNRESMEYDLLSKIADSLPTDDEDNPYGFGEYFGEMNND